MFELTGPNLYRSHLPDYLHSMLKSLHEFLLWFCSTTSDHSDLLRFCRAQPASNSQVTMYISQHCCDLVVKIPLSTIKVLRFSFGPLFLSSLLISIYKFQVRYNSYSVAINSSHLYNTTLEQYYTRKSSCVNARGIPPAV